ncbi:MAG: hypothetical protein KDD47_21660, partial [Acidobacteria bacterium]|nr:hypothetical protein [Acidobacteriota bacterium]
DEYGGSLENRARFPVAVVRAVREALGDGPILSYRTGALELVEGGLSLTQSCQDQGQAGCLGGRRRAAGSAADLCQDPARLLLSAGPCESEAQRGEHGGAATGESRRLLRFLYCVLGATQGCQGKSRSKVTVGKAGLELEGLSEAPLGFIVVPAKVVDEAQIRSDHQRKGIQAMRPASAGHRLLVTTERCEHEPVPMMSRGVAVVERQGPQEALLRLAPMPVVDEAGIGQRGMGLGQVSVQTDGPAGGFPGLRKGCRRRRVAVEGQQDVGIRQSGEGTGGSVVQLGSPLEAGDGLLEALASALVPVESPPQVGLVGFRIDGRRPSQLLLLPAGQPQLQRLDDPPGDGILDSENVVVDRIEGLAVEERAVVHSNQLNGESQPVPGPLHRSLQDAVDPQRPPDLNRIFVRGSVPRDRAGGPDTELGETAQPSDQSVRHAQTQELRRLPVAKYPKR